MIKNKAFRRCAHERKKKRLEKAQHYSRDTLTKESFACPWNALIAVFDKSGDVVYVGETLRPSKVVFAFRVCGAQWSAVVLVISVAYTGPITCRSACRRGTKKEERTCVFLL